MFSKCCLIKCCSYFFHFKAFPSLSPPATLVGTVLCLVEGYFLAGQLFLIHSWASNSERYTLVSLILKVVKYFLAQKYFSSAPALRPSGPAVRDLSWQLERWSDVYISAKHLPPCQPVCTTTMHQCETQKTNTKH